MRRATLPLIVLTCMTIDAPHAAAAGGVRRFALIAGANFGGADRPELKYAVSDAESISRVLEELGGVDAADRILLRQPRLAELIAALDDLDGRMTAARARGAAAARRVELLVYYSGHADEKGLLLGEDRYSYQSLRQRMQSLPADVRIAVLDACASGAITRLKGGTRRPPFLVDESSDMRGHAFLTSSSEDEGAQESDSVGASFFTHYLISGLRGAADVTGEGTVTLNEAYRFAFDETLGRTTETRGGAQHPSYDINLSGTGDVVITDLRQTSASVVLGEPLSGRCYIRDAEQRLVVELAKPTGRAVELGLAPGEYEVRCQDRKDAFLSRPKLTTGERVVLGLEDFDPTKREEIAWRGGPRRARIGELHGRHRLELRVGYWNKGRSAGQASGVTSRVGTDSLSAGGGYSYWIRPDLAVGLAISNLDATIDSTVAASVESHVSSVNSYMLSVRRDFLKGGAPARWRPYVTAGLGPYIRSGTRTTTGSSAVRMETVTEATLGGHLGGGIDVQVHGNVLIGARAGYNIMARFSEPLGGHDDYGGFEMGISLSWLFGRGARQPTSGER